MGRALGFFLLVVLAAVILTWAGGGHETTSAYQVITFAIDADTAGNTGGSLGTVQDCRRVNVSTAFDGSMDTQIDVVVFDTPEPPAPMGYDATVTYDSTKVGVTDAGTDPLIKTPGAADLTIDECPGYVTCTSNLYTSEDGTLNAAAGYLSGGPGTAGNGAILRIGLDIDGTGPGYVTTFSFEWPTGYVSGTGAGWPTTDECGYPSPPCILVSGVLAVNMECPVPPEAVSVEAGAGQTITTDTESDGATVLDPVETAVTTPSAGIVSIEEGDITTTPPAGWSLLTQQVNVAAPAATSANPLIIVFRLDSSRVPAGEDQNSIRIFKDGLQVPGCTGPPGTASPDPCVSSRALLPDGDVEITVLTSTASAWNLGVAAAAVGGIAELPEVSDSSGPNHVALAGLAAAAVLALTAGAWCARRRWLR